MALQRTVIPVIFNQGIDVGGEDPRIKVGGLLKAENLLVDRGGVLVARGGLTSIGKGARAVASGTSTIVFPDARNSTRLFTTGTLNNSVVTSDKSFVKTTWSRVAAGPEINADVNSWCQMTPLVYSEYLGGTNVYAHLTVTNGATRTAVVSVYNYDSGGVIESKTLLSNTNVVGITFDSEDGNLYFGYINAATTAIVYSKANLYASTIAFSSNASVTGLTLNCAASYAGGFGMVRYEKQPTTDANVFIKRLIVSYYHTNASAHPYLAAVAVNTTSMAIGADTNETAQWSHAEDNTGTHLYTDVQDLGLRLADPDWKLSGTNSNTMAVAKWVWVNTNACTQELQMGPTGLAFGTETQRGSGPTPVSVRLGDSNYKTATRGVSASATSYFTTNSLVQVLDQDSSITHGLFAACRPFVIDSGKMLSVVTPCTYHGGYWYGNQADAIVSTQLKASSATQNVLMATAAADATNSTTSFISARLAVGSAYTGSTRSNTYAQIYYHHDVQKFAGRSYGNSSYTNAYYVTLLEQRGNKKQVVLYRASTEDLEDGFFSTFTASPIQTGLVVSGGYPTVLSGGRITPVAFPAYPEGLTVAIVNNASTNTYSSLGNVAFCATWEFQGVNGELYRTAPSPTVTIALTNTANIVNVRTTGPYNFMLTPYDKVSTVIYRTEPNGTQFFECSRQARSSSYTTGLVAHIIMGETLTTNDAFGTSPYLRSLYTQTEAENIYPFQHKAGCTHADRYFYAVGDGDIYYSKPNQGGVGLEFNEFFNLKVPASGGEIIALASMDDKLVIFKRNEIYSTYGDGFGPNLGGSNLAPPRRIANGVGCSNRLCVAVIPQGVLFLSDSGIWLLGRDEQVSRIGANVSYYTSNYTYTCAATNSKKRYAIFVSSTSGAPALIFSFDSGIWTTFTGLYAGQKFVSCDDDGNDIVGGGINTAATSSTNAGDAYLPIYMTNANSAETFNASVETGWYGFSGLLGYQRWKKTALFMENKDGHRLTVNTAYDGDPVWIDSQEFDSNALAEYDYTAHYSSMTNSQLADQTYKLEFAGSRQKTDMLRHQFVASNITGGAVSFLGMAFDVAQKPSTVRLGSNKKIG